MVYTSLMSTFKKRYGVELYRYDDQGRRISYGIERAFWLRESAERYAYAWEERSDRSVIVTKVVKL
jgi:hypothetical protein